jgi:glycine/D-amino acid oxidase-like deaminating enzyme
MHSVDVAIIGTGSIGLAVAYYLVRDHGVRRIALIDPLPPMSLTSAQSGENYRNWWPHRVMTAFTDHSIDLMEQLDEASGGRLNMTRGGYALVTRRERPQDLIDALHLGYADSPGQIRLRESDSDSDYTAPRRTPWQGSPSGVDVLLDRALIRHTFPAFAQDIATVIHIRRAGSIDAQQMGSLMLEAIREAGGTLIRGEVKSIKPGSPFTLEIATPESGSTTTTISHLHADRIVNAAGPSLQDIASMLGEDLQVECVFQQKIAFPDTLQAVARRVEPEVLGRDERHLAPGALARLAQPPDLLRERDVLAAELVADVEEEVVEFVAAAVQPAVDADEELVHARVLLVPPAKRLIQPDGVRQLGLPVDKVHVALPRGARHVRLHHRPVGPHRRHAVHVVRDAAERGLLALGVL